MKIILAIETSCDDTSIAIMEDNNVLSLKTHSQLEEHKKFGGVIPELASRYHSNDINNLILSAIMDSGKKLADLDLVAVTYGPGLVNTLQIGLQVAKTICQKYNIPLYAINHLEAHAFSPFIGNDNVPNKAIIVIASGGHTQIIKMKKLFNYEILGETRDDAIGEAFDKVSKVLNLGYPGGPIIDKIWTENKEINHKFKIPNLKEYDMSFSGLKSSVINLIRNEKQKKKIDEKDIAKAFQKAAIDQLVNKIKYALSQNKSFDTLIIGGGVSANSYLRRELEKLKDIKIFLPRSIYTGDNAAMIGYICNLKLEKNMIIESKLNLDAIPRGNINGK